MFRFKQSKRASILPARTADPIVADPVRPRSILLRFIALLILALCGCTYSVVHNGTVNETKTQEIEAGIQRFRGLDFTAPVPLVLKTRDQALEMMRKEIARDHTEDQMRIGGLTGAMTGVYPAGMNLKSETMKLLRSQIAGFYDPHEKQMVLVEGAIDANLWSSAANLITHRDLVGEMLLSHELTHALQDQHFRIEQMIDRVKDNDDRDLALKAVAEGDATLAGYGYVVGNLDDASIDSIVDRMDDLPRTFAAQSADVPMGLSAPMIFQYADGVRFVAEAYRRGGWTAVDAIYADPPRATLQVMHPELYFEHRAQLVDIDLNGYQSALKDWGKADDDTYGAMLIKLIVQRNLQQNLQGAANSDLATAVPETAVTERWSGDRMIVLQKNHALTVLWIVAFQDDASAARFGQIYTSILDKISAPEMAHRLQVRASNVLIAIGDGARQFDRFAPAIWRASVVTPIASARPAGAKIAEGR
jgi:hypothetical protein